MVGPTRATLEGRAPQKMVHVLRGQLESLCLGYLEREARSLQGSRRRNLTTLESRRGRKI